MKKYLFFPFTLLLFMLAACGGNSTASPSAASTPAPTPSAVQTEEPVPDTPEWGDQTFGQTFAADDGTVAMTAAYTLPQIENAEKVMAWQTINAWYEDKGEALLENVQESGNQALDDLKIAQTMKYDFEPYTDEEIWKLFDTPSDAVISILRTHYMSMGGASPTTFYFAETFDLESGKKLTLDNIFSVPTEEYLKRIISTLNEQNRASQTPVEAGGLYDEFNADYFYLTEDSLVIFYQEGTFGGGMGTLEFSIPYKDLEDILAAW